MAQQKSSNTQQQPCSTCQGNGLINAGGNVVVACPICDGTGKAWIPGLFYTYAQLIAVAANATVTQLIQILNAPFKWIFSTSVQTGPWTVQIQDSKAQRQFFNTQLHYSLIFGTAQNPFPVLNPWTFDQNGNIQLTITDLSGGTNNIWVAFIGVQLVPSAQNAGSSGSSSSSSKAGGMSGYGY